MYGNKKSKKINGFNVSLIMNNSFEDFAKVKKISSRNNSITHYCNKLLSGQSHQTLYPKKFSISKHKKKATREMPSGLWNEVNQDSGKRPFKMGNKMSKSRGNKLDNASYNVTSSVYYNHNKPESSLSCYSEGLKKKNIRKFKNEKKYYHSK